MPTDPKPPQRADVEDLVLGLFAWLRQEGHATATTPVGARRALATALSAGRLSGPCKTIGTAFLVALETWLHLVAPELSARQERRQTKDHAEAAREWLQDGQNRSEAIRLVQTFPMKRLSALVGRIGESAAQRAARQGASPERRQSVRSEWTDKAELLAEMLESLESSLRSARGVPFARTRKEWVQFEQELVRSLRRTGFSYGEITRLRRPGVRPTGADSAKYRTERERVRGSARRAKSRKS